MRIDHDTLVRSVLYRYVSGKKTVLLYRHFHFFSDLTQLPQHFWPLSQEPINLFLYRPNAGSYHQGAPISTAWCNSAGGVRKPYGGIRWLGLKRGTVVQHAAHGLCTVRRKEERRGGPPAFRRRDNKLWDIIHPVRYPCVNAGACVCAPPQFCPPLQMGSFGFAARHIKAL